MLHFFQYLLSGVSHVLARNYTSDPEYFIAHAPYLQFKKYLF